MKQIILFSSSIIVILAIISFSLIHVHAEGVINTTSKKIIETSGQPIIDTGNHTNNNSGSSETSTAEGPLRAYCDVTSGASTVFGDSVTWKVDVHGGTGSYRYSWRGSEGISGSGRSNTIRYKTAGTKTTFVTVTSGNESKEFGCGRITIYEPPLYGYCETSVIISHDSAKITWRVHAFGGVGDYTYDWNGSDGLDGNRDDRTITKEYSDPQNALGSKTANITIWSGSRDDRRRITTHCGTNIKSVSTTTGSNRISCSAPRDPVTNKKIIWSGNVSGGSPFTYSWSGSDGLTSDTLRAEYTYSSKGEKRAIFSASSDDGLNGSVTCGAYIADSSAPGVDGTGGGCFIATAAYGSYMQDDVLLLREFRDTTLKGTTLGDAFIKTYYTVSPPIANVIRNSDTLKAITRTALTPVIDVVRLIEQS